MLSVWPELLTYQFVAIGVMRIVVGYLFLATGTHLLHTVAHDQQTPGWRRFSGYGFALAQCAVGAALVLGWYVQPAALLGVLLTILGQYAPARTSIHERHYGLLLGIVTLALLFLGAGAFAIDLPL